MLNFRHMNLFSSDWFYSFDRRSFRKRNIISARGFFFLSTSSIIIFLSSMRRLPSTWSSSSFCYIWTSLRGLLQTFMRAILNDPFYVGTYFHLLHAGFFYIPCQRSSVSSSIKLFISRVSQTLLFLEGGDLCFLLASSILERTVTKSRTVRIFS